MRLRDRALARLARRGHSHRPASDAPPPGSPARPARLPRRGGVPARLPAQRGPAGRRDRRARRRLHRRLGGAPRAPPRGARAAAGAARPTDLGRAGQLPRAGRGRASDTARAGRSRWTPTSAWSADFRARAERVHRARAAPGAVRLLRAPARAVGLAGHAGAPTACGRCKGPPRLFELRPDHRFDERALHAGKVPLQARRVRGGGAAGGPRSSTTCAWCGTEDRRARRERYERLDPNAELPAARGLRLPHRRDAGSSCAASDAGAVTTASDRGAAPARASCRRGRAPA